MPTLIPLGPAGGALRGALHHYIEFMNRRSAPPHPPRRPHGGRDGVPKHLYGEDRQDHERILDEALRSAPHRPDLPGSDAR